MNVQKEVTISQLKAKFVKEGQNSSKMTPLLQFTVGKLSARTQNLQAGKEPAWNDEIVLTFFDETHIIAKAYDDDGTQRELMGSGKLQIKSLRAPGGMIEQNLTTDDGEVLCTITGKYTIKNLNVSPLLLIRNARLDLVREDKQLIKVRPYLSFTAEQTTVCTEVKDQISGCSISWSDCLRLKVKEGSKLVIEMIDKDGSSSPLFTYDCSLREFRSQQGNKKFTVTDRSYNQLGQLYFQYETINLVSKEQSVKNHDKEKKAENQLNAISLQKLVLRLKKQEAEVYARITVGCSSSQSEVVKSNSEFQVPINGCLYAESRDNKLAVTVWERNIVKDELLASGVVYLDNFHNGQNQIILHSEDGKDEAGTAILCVNLKATNCKTLILSNISISVSEEGDIVGNNEPFLKASVGCCSGRTQTGNQGIYTFKRPIELKFGTEDSVCFEIWDQDVASNILLYSENIALSTFKSKGEHSVSISKAGEQGQSDKKGKLSFKYEYKSSGSGSQSPKKQTVKMTENPKKDIPKEVQSQRVDHSALDSVRNNKKSLPSQNDQYDNITINRSKETLNLPSIMGSIHQAYGDRIFDRQSAATLQKSILAYSMPKADRFNQGPKYSGEPSYCLDSCFKKTNTKGAGFGFGRKKQFPDWMERNMKENPAPGAYFQNGHDLRNRGPTFGLGHKYYERVMIPRDKKSLGGHTIARKLSPIREPTPK